MVNSLFKQKVKTKGNIIETDSAPLCKNQRQTKDLFSKKWLDYKTSSDKEKFFKMQKEWYLSLYGFKDEAALARFLSGRRYIFDAGCGLGYKAAWFAGLAPECTVFAMDISDTLYIAAEEYKYIKNIYFIRGDIASTMIRDGVIDYVSCDQVLHHTERPKEAFRELVRMLSPCGEIACYVYKKKALPRELIDDYFRKKSGDLSHEELRELACQVTQLGKALSGVKISIDVPDIPLLGIKGGTTDIQRFIYWNFLKCFWNPELGYDTSLMVNYDWYGPSNAWRFDKDEFLKMAGDSGLSLRHLHEEEACLSGRFIK